MSVAAKKLLQVRGAELKALFIHRTAFGKYMVVDFQAVVMSRLCSLKTGQVLKNTHG